MNNSQLEADRQQILQAQSKGTLEFQAHAYIDIGHAWQDVVRKGDRFRLVGEINREQPVRERPRPPGWRLPRPRRERQPRGA